MWTEEARESFQLAGPWSPGGPLVTLDEPLSVSGP